MTHSPGSGIATESEPCRCAELDQLRAQLTTAKAEENEWAAERISLQNDLTTAQSRITELEKLLAEIRETNFDEVAFHQMCKVTKVQNKAIGALEAHVFTLRGALKPFADAHIAAEQDDIDDDTYETGEGFYRVDIWHWTQAARALTPEPDAGTDAGEVDGETD